MKTQDLIRVTLQNEMDLILAHKRSMRLAELANLSLAAQTTFATAVSEVSRNTIEFGQNGCLVLGISEMPRQKFISARIIDNGDQISEYEGVEYAKRLVDRCNISRNEKETAIELFFRVPAMLRIDANKIDEWRNMFRNEPAISAYDEIKRKNELLQELAEKLKESEGQYQTLTNALPIIIFSLNEKGEIIFANEWMKRFTGYDLNELNKTRWKHVLHPEDYVSFTQLLDFNNASNTSALKTQCRLRHKHDSEYYWHLASVSPLKSDDGKQVHGIGYIVDINAQKLIEETLQDNRELKDTQAKLKQQQEALENNISELNRSNRELQEFAYVASHDLQEPARKISFYSDYLISKYAHLLDPKGLLYLNNMQAASQRMRNLISDLLAFAQVERESVRLNTVSLNSVISKVLENLEMAIEEKSADIVVEQLPDIQADENMLHQLFENLVMNAIKYSRPDVKPEVRIWSEEKEDQVIVHVVDNGIGFDEQYLPQMFTLFQRLHSSQQYEGTGLGLAICQKIVALHQGGITATSTLGKGSDFIVSFPNIQAIEHEAKQRNYINGR